MYMETKHPKKKIKESTRMIVEDQKEGTNFENDILASPDEIHRITKRWKKKYKEDLNLDKTTSVKEIEELWITLKKCR
ncbi:hypothetical protein [Bacillus sp. CDB3]|uniref:hypothetical protein n=1 Tax=Bacillus sp. CDB3 TaxID=360310 RepID=UPI0009D8214E|nr:hypothetical protein [Bacillus sp. CDB3]OQR53392.1 hypothetical protein CDB3_30215 [Bacillus sp. CDB3]